MNFGCPLQIASACLYIFYPEIQTGALAMLHDWEENLAIITANRTKDDELVIIHLGDCLWKEKAEVCYVYINQVVSLNISSPYISFCAAPFGC